MKNKMKKSTGLRKYILAVSLLLMVIVVENYASLLQPVVTMKGKIIDNETKLGVDAKIIIYDLEGKVKFRTKASGSNNGEYFISGLKPESEYKIKIIPETGYLEAMKNIIIPKADEYKEIINNYGMQNIDNLLSLDLNDGIFAKNMGVFKNGIDNTLIEFIQSIKNSDNIVLIKYYDELKNRKLIQKRIKAIQDYLVYSGINIEKIRIIHKRQSKEISYNDKK